MSKTSLVMSNQRPPCRDSNFYSHQAARCTLSLYITTLATFLTILITDVHSTCHTPKLSLKQAEKTFVLLAGKYFVDPKRDEASRNNFFKAETTLSIGDTKTLAASCAFTSWTLSDSLLRQFLATTSTKTT